MGGGEEGEEGCSSSEDEDVSLSLEELDMLPHCKSISHNDEFSSSNKKSHTQILPTYTSINSIPKGCSQFWSHTLKKTQALQCL